MSKASIVRAAGTARTSLSSWSTSSMVAGRTQITGTALSKRGSAIASVPSPLSAIAPGQRRGVERSLGQAATEGRLDAAARRFNPAVHALVACLAVLDGLHEAFEAV